MMLPTFWRTATRTTWVLVLIYPFRSLYIKFQAFKTEVDYLNYYNSQIIYLEKVLNDKWDLLNRGIYIDNLADLDRLYIFNKLEAKPTTFVYNKWQPLILYPAGSQISYKLKIYQCTSPTTGQFPDITPGVWRYQKDAPIMRNKQEFNLQNDFIVYVPSSVTFDESQMRATINQYKFAGLNYQIIIY